MGSPGGCLKPEQKDLTVEAGETTYLNATLTSDECSEGVDGTSGEVAVFGTSVQAGSKVRLQLVAPLSPVEIRPVTEEVQILAGNSDKGSWSWAVKPGEVGDQQLLLVATAFGPDGTTAAPQGPPIPLTLHAKGSFSFYAGKTFKEVQSVMTSLQAIALGVAAVLGAVAGGLVKLGQWGRRRLKSTTAAESNGGGYI